MRDPVDTYLAVLVIGIALTLIVGQILIRSARPFLQDVFQKPESAASVTRLLVVLFHLVVLGVIALVATIDITLDHPIQTMVVRVGLVLLVLGAAYGGTLLLLTRLRERRRVQMSIDEHAEQARQHRAQQYGDPQGGVDPHGLGGVEVHPVSDPGPGR
ncbi:MAG: hypothetical protein ACRDTC_19060 [Pseudonocardiaceae bacterium]